MTRAMAILSLSLALGLAAFWAGGRARAPGCGESPACHEGMGWLKSEFALDDETFARVSQLHDGYKPACEHLCRRVVVNRRRIEAEAGRGEGFSPGLDAALREASDLRYESQRLYLRHAHAVAAAMPPIQGHRYLEMMKARVFSPCECGSGMCLH